MEALACTQLNNLTDTYIQNRKMTYRYCTDTSFANDSTHGVLNQAAVMGMAGLAGDREYQDSSKMTQSLAHIDYILVNKNQKITFDSNNVQKTNAGSQQNFTLYRITNSDSIRVDAQAPNRD